MPKNARAPGGGQPTSENLSDYVATSEAAAMLGVTQPQIRHLLLAGKLRGLKVARNWLVYQPSIEEYYKTKSPKGRPASHGSKLHPR